MSICVVCGSDTNLNTKLTININNENVIVNLCDDHAEDTTIKLAREKYLERQDKINQLIEQAKKLGLDPSSLLGKINVESRDKAIIPDKKATEKTISSNLQSENAVKHNEDEQAVDKRKAGNRQNDVKSKNEEGWISTDRYESVDKGFTSVGGQGAASYSSYKIAGQTDVLDESLRQGKIKMGIAEGRGGSPIPVPLERVDGTGTTRIRIVNVENDQSLQKRFKGMASNQEHQPDFRHGYNDATRTCPICRGDCVVNGKDCPKCKGSGLISVY